MLNPPPHALRRPALESSLGQRAAFGGRRAALGRGLLASVSVYALVSLPEAALAQTAVDAPTTSPAPPSAAPPAGPPPAVTPPSAGAPPAVVPPRVLSQVQPVYPEDARRAGLESHLVLFVVVSAEGRVSSVEVASTGGEVFDDAAIAAVKQWVFEPATKGGVPVASRIRIPFTFSLPQQDSAPEPAPASAPEDLTHHAPHAPHAPHGAATPAPAAIPASPINEVRVHGERPKRTEVRSSSDFKLDADVLAAAPSAEGVDLLRRVPGLVVGRGEGGAVAHNYMLRGFDATHGQDIEFHVGGLPVNLPSHIHGQGYTDLNFLIAPVVHTLRIKEGIHDPSQGDFAVAGSLGIDLGVAEKSRGVQLESALGSFGTFRQLALWAPRDGHRESFGALQVQTTDGFGQNRAGRAGSAILQHRFGQGEVTYRALGILSTARSDLAGVLRRQDVSAGEVCFLCVYPTPTARAQTASTARFLGGFFIDYARPRGDNGQLGFWLGFDDFHAQTNFTGFIERSWALEGVSGRGDLIEQRNGTTSLGLTGRYRTEHLRPLSWLHGALELGVDGRLDLIDQTQNLIDASVRNQTWDRRVDAAVRAADLGLWGDVDVQFDIPVSLRVGLRADLLSYDVEDRLGNFAPTIRPQDAYIPGFRRTALGLAVGPRASLTYRPLWWLSILSSYGEGYRSPQARQLEDGERAPFTKVYSGDLGARVDLGDQFEASLGGYFTQLSDDVAFDPSEGRLERIGATRRLGGALQVTTRPLPGLVGSVSATYVAATLLEPPPATPEEPQPPFVEGQSLPYVPPLVLRADLGASRVLAPELGGQALRGQVGLGFTLLSRRPLPYGVSTASVSLLDASCGLLWGPFDLSFEVYNALDRQYAAVEYSFASDWDPDDGVRPRTPARHFSAGAPFSWLLSLGVTL